MGKLSEAFDIIRMCTVHRGKLSRANDRLSQHAWNGEDGDKSRMNLKDIKATLTDTEVTTLFEKFGSGSELTNMKDWVCRIIKGASHHLPDEEIFPFIEFLTNDDVTETTLQHHYRLYDISHAIEEFMERTPPEKREELARTMATDDFVQTLFKKSNPTVDFIRHLSRGLRIEEFNSILYETKLFKDIPHNDQTEEAYMRSRDANIIALERLLDNRPELRDHESIRGKSLPDIKDINIPEKEKTPYVDQAWKILNIALKHCKGAPEQNLDNNPNSAVS